MGHGGRTNLVNPFPIRGFAGTGAKKPWWAAGAATWAEIADESVFCPAWLSEPMTQQTLGATRLELRAASC